MSGVAIAPRDLASLILAAAFWGFGTVVSKAALAEIPPVSLLAIQLAASLAILAVLMRWQGVPLRGEGPRLLGRLGLLNPGLAYALGLLGLASITASVSVLLWALEPVMIVLLAAVVLRERITPRLVALSAVALAGTVLVIDQPSAVGGHAIGVAFTLAGIGCCAIYTVVTRRALPGASETSQVVLAQQGYGLALALVLVAVAAIAGVATLPTAVTPVGLTSAVLSGAMYYAGAYWLYLGALRRVPASLAASTFYLIPLVGVAAGALLLGERLSAGQWLGAALVLLAVVGILVRPSTAPVPLPDPSRS